MRIKTQRCPASKIKNDIVIVIIKQKNLAIRYTGKIKNQEKVRMKISTGGHCYGNTIYKINPVRLCDVQSGQSFRVTECLWHNPPVKDAGSLRKKIRFHRRKHSR